MKTNGKWGLHTDLDYHQRLQVGHIHHIYWHLCERGRLIGRIHDQRRGGVEPWERRFVQLVERHPPRRRKQLRVDARAVVPFDLGVEHRVDG